MTDIDWTAAARRVVWVPAEHREPSVTAAAARLLLRCSDRSFAQLVDLGLTGTDGPDGPLYDVHDVQNAGLYSGTGVTDVEVAMRFVLRFMHQSRDELTRARRWSYVLSLAPCAGDEPVLVYRPAPEDSGGDLISWDPPDAYDGDFFRMAPGTEVTGALITRGEPDTIRSPAIRQAMNDLLDSGARWQYLPRALELEPLDTYARGAGSGAVLCAVLAHLLREAGIASATRRGWIIAVSQVPHSLVEVVDDDGRRKFLDPSLALLATRNGFGPPEFRDFATGSTINRIVLSRCPKYDKPDDAVFACRPSGR